MKTWMLEVMRRVAADELEERWEQLLLSCVLVRFPQSDLRDSQADAGLTRQATDPALAGFNVGSGKDRIE